MGIEQTLRRLDGREGVLRGCRDEPDRNYFPNDSTDSGQYCWALTSSQNPQPYAASACHDSFSKHSAGEQAAHRGNPSAAGTPGAWLTTKWVG